MTFALNYVATETKRFTRPILMALRLVALSLNAPIAKLQFVELHVQA